MRVVVEDEASATVEVEAVRDAPTAAVERRTLEDGGGEDEDVSSKLIFRGTTGGVGGYECVLAALSSLDRLGLAEPDPDGPIAFVRHPNANAPSIKLGSVLGSARSPIYIPGGNAGERRRRYHPRLGRWTVHTSRLVACSKTFSTISSSARKRSYNNVYFSVLCVTHLRL
jgi:hypothetical protein